jgi:hypothetical protein
MSWMTEQIKIVLTIYESILNHHTNNNKNQAQSKINLKKGIKILK